MIRIFLPLICAALGLAAASCRQSEGAFAPTEAPASPRSTSHDAAPAAMASPGHTARADGTARNTLAADGSATGTSPSVPVIAQSSPKPSAPPADQPPSADQSVPADQSPPADPSSSADQGPASSASSSTTAASASTSAKASASTLAEHRASKLIGMPVTALDGTPLGKVKDVIFDPQGRATHVVIAYDTEPAAGPEEIPEGKPRARPDGKLAAVPWDTAIARINGGKLVLDGAKLESAPSFTAQQWPNLQDPAWSANADAYWRKVAPPPASARRNAQVDSTARLRARPTRDGD
jgi:sporulation protein YlmC with PRC-barrel domain